GSNERVAETAQRWRAEAPSLEIECMTASLHDPGGEHTIRRLLAELRMEDAGQAGLTGDWVDAEGLHCVDYLALVLDYNTFKVRPETTATILDGSGVSTHQGGAAPTSQAFLHVEMSSSRSAASCRRSIPALLPELPLEETRRYQISMR